MRLGQASPTCLCAGSAPLRSQSPGPGLAEGLPWQQTAQRGATGQDHAQG